MPKSYWVYSSEQVYYTTMVYADSAQEATRLVESGTIEVGNPIDSEMFQVDSVEEIEEEE